MWGFDTHIAGNTPKFNGTTWNINRWKKKNKNKIEVGETNGRINGIEIDGKNKIKGERNDFMSDDMYMPI